MGENNDRLLRMAEATLQRVGLNVQRNRAWLVQALYRVDADAAERAAKVCDAKAREWNGLLEGGKGEYGKTGYVRDDTWKAWITSEHAARSLASAIRSTLPTPAARAGEENQ